MMDSDIVLHQLTETWRINNECNLILLESISDEQLPLSLSPRGGASVGYQLAHIYNVRYWKTEVVNKLLVKDSRTIVVADPKTTESLAIDFIKSYQWILEIIQKSVLENDGKVKGYKIGIIPLIGNFLVHEGHHRGSIISVLKNSGVKLPKEIQWGLWEWSKM